MHHNLLILDDGDTGRCVRLVGPYPIGEAATTDEPRMFAHVKAHGYHEERVGYWVYTDVQVISPGDLGAS